MANIILRGHTPPELKDKAAFLLNWLAGGEHRFEPHHIAGVEWSGDQLEATITLVDGQSYVAMGFEVTVLRHATRAAGVGWTLAEPPVPRPAANGSHPQPFTWVPSS